MDADISRITVRWVASALTQLAEAHQGGDESSIQAARAALEEVIQSIEEVMAHPEAA